MLKIMHTYFITKTLPLARSQTTFLLIIVMEHLLIFHLSRMINPPTYARLFPVFIPKVGEKGAPEAVDRPLDTSSGGGTDSVARFSLVLTYARAHTHIHTLENDEYERSYGIGSTKSGSHSEPDQRAVHTPRLHLRALASFAGSLIKVIARENEYITI